MKTKLPRFFVALALLALSTLNLQLSTCFAQGTAFTYQGRLNSGSAPANGNYDVVFALYNDPLLGSQVGSTITNSAVPVTNGLFTTTFDFGATPWTGQLLYLQILVRTNGPGTLTALIPRQQVTPAPYSILAANAGSANSVAAANVSGVLLNSSLPANPVFSGAVTAGSITANAYSGNGGGLTNLNASQLTSLSSTTALGQTFNFFVGQSGNATTSGGVNTSLGYEALATNTSGSYNTAIGGGAMISNTSGGENTAIGAWALLNNTIGYYNTASGKEALNKNTSGQYNTASGWHALIDNMNGFANTADGSQALVGNVSGSFNTASGAAALGYLGSGNGAGGSSNIALGYLAGINYQSNESDNIDIGNQGVSGDNNIIRIGSSQILTYISGYLVGNGGGLTNISTSQLTGSGSGNVFVGPAGNFTMNADGNTASGDQAFASNLNGDFNTANGYQALFSNTGGGGSDYSKGNQNTASGYVALYSNTIGDDNTGDGHSALNSNVSGNNNTASGAEALENLGANGAGGTNNIALGYLAGSAFYGNESSNIDIGNIGMINENNIIRIGSSQTQTYLAGVINGNGGGLTNLNAAQLNGSATLNSLAVNSPLTLEGISSASINFGANQILEADNNANFFGGGGAGSANNGSQNTGVGAGVLGGNNGNDNTAVGYHALFSNSSGSHNTAVGNVVLSQNTSGSYNTAVGDSAFGQIIFRGTNNIALGYQAGHNFSGIENSNIDIGNQGLSGDNNITRIGSSQTQTYVAGVINGNGGGLTNLSAAQLTGTVTAASLPANTALLTANQTFTATNIFNSPVGLVSANPLGLLEIQGGADNTGASDQKDIALAYRTGGYRHWIRTRHNSSPSDNAIDFYVNSSSTAGGSTGPTNGSVLTMSLNAGKVGVATSEPQATLDVNGSFRVNAGTTFTNYQAGQAQMAGSSSLVATNFTFTFPKAFNGIPKVVLTANTDPAYSTFGDTFVVSVRVATTTTCTVNVIRVDSPAGWSETVRVNWIAWE